MSLPRPRLLLLGAAIAAGLLAFGVKLSLIHGYASDVPYMDEWDAVGRVLLLPAAHGGLHTSDFLQPQNEHRVVLSRLISYALLRADGQWDGLLEMVVSAAIHASLCAALVMFARRLLGGIRFALAAVMTVLLFVLAFDWENTLQGFQSQLYLLEWSAFAMCLLCVPARPLGPRWWAGWLVGLAGLGTMSSGFMGPAAVLLVMGLRAATGVRPAVRDYAAAALLAFLCAAGIASIAPVPGHLILRAQSPWQWITASSTALSWPEFDWPAAFLLLQLPMAALITRRIRERRIPGSEAALVALALWTWMQVAALAFARGNGTIRGSRYTDLYAVGAFANILALGLLWTPSKAGRPWALVGVAWGCLFLCGLRTQQEIAHRVYLDDFRSAKPKERAALRAYLRTGDARKLQEVPASRLPYPRPDALAAWLSDPAIREVLPESVRPALTLSPDGSESSGFEPAAPSDSGAHSWIARKGPARFTSEPLPYHLLPFLRLSIRGSADLSTSAVRLEPEESTPSDAEEPLRGSGWIERDLPVPSAAGARIVVDLPPGDHWIEFTEPTELGWGSRAVGRLLGSAGAITASAAALFGMAITALLLLDYRSREP